MGYERSRLSASSSGETPNCRHQRKRWWSSEAWSLGLGVSIDPHSRVIGVGACRLVLILILNFRAVAGELTPAQMEFFENKIRPILAENCYKCHSLQAEKVKGGLLLDTREGVLKGSESGPVIVPGSPDKSLLIKAVRYTDPDLQMPPKGKKLSDSQIADLETWVKMGAPDPRVATLAQKNW